MRGTGLVCVGWLAVFGAAGAQVFTGLGQAPGGTTSKGAGVSADGSVVVGTAQVGGVTRAFRWTSGGGVVLLAPIAGGEAGNATSAEVSDDGSVVVGSSAAGPGVSHAYRWTAPGGTLDLLTLTGGTNSVANGVSGDGQVVVGYSQSSEGQRAMSWTQAGGMVNLGALAGFTSSLALGADADGSVVVGYAQTPGSARALRWVSGVLEDLGTISGYSSSFGYACSSDGSVVVGRVSAVGVGGQPFRWTPDGGMEGLGTLDGDTSGFALGVSGDGNVVVGSSNAGSASRAYMWTRAAGLTDLNVYLPTLGADLTGWTLTSATDISPDGRTIVGTGLHGGVQEAWRVRLNTACPADLGAAGGVAGRDGRLDNNDFIAFIGLFFAADLGADLGAAGGQPGSDGAFDNNDFIAFISLFFAGC
ncbi:MAG: hypothetical protein K2Q09_00145 [Phycisphaerales bacterium]|nr:hypothetical protein [Phycisphaerales bacterium]